MAQLGSKSMLHTPEWQIRFVRLAEMVAKWSKDPSTQVGSVIVRPDKIVVGMGYNGFPRGLDDSPDLYEMKDVKQARVIHSEMNAIHNAQKGGHDISDNGCIIYNWPVAPCERCAAHVIQAGIKDIVYGGPDKSDYATRYRDQLNRAQQMYLEAGVNLWRIDIA